MERSRPRHRAARRAGSARAAHLGLVDAGTRGRAPVARPRGFGYLAALLALPGRDISAVELAAAVQADDQPAIDDTALRAYRRRLREVDAEIAAAEDDADLGRMEVLRSERDALLDELRTTVGLAGRVRGLGAPPERARTAVRKAITRALNAFIDRDAVLGAELRSAVVTGSVCRYEPPHGAAPWRVTGRGVRGSGASVSSTNVCTGPSGAQQRVGDLERPRGTCAGPG